MSILRILRRFPAFSPRWACSLEGYTGGLAWVELSGLAVPDRIYKYYICICLGIVIGVVLGNIRERVYNSVMNTLKIRNIFRKIDERINRKTVEDRFRINHGGLK